MKSPSSALVVIAHPDDEGFGLGALVDHLVADGTEVRVLCLAHGEASTLGATSALGAVREAELRAGAERIAARRLLARRLALQANRERVRMQPARAANGNEGTG